ncbi:ribosomal protein S12 methylthiotransferase [Haemophilus haemolyticus]|jgi:ribosomal protein S12 methylthiotransferase rimO|uniref:Ribosomal protein uS12 methylthiotransferase RimO n=2 Tax=Haemophilus TaxID=724 RepID=A0A502JBY5_HAEHA|nr:MULTISPECIES: 30S ribosomal protein S12 methylthiotransferase RimO [Haemophilus]EHO45211.1 ribosomal protein S12 methylthiotransferase RimO [Haemophilus sp. oral taxon 851 str. F0397]KAA5523038.1 30S ribosomal protein S12 methylthiotransferase RimO [Haemophilus seminalis]KKZ53819.1 ribosomal protein S12 methylthiotransferase [Haemophilus haemolyticus]MDK7280623.1 30S ribosomal protein S12 methylthiotransferase RimO [Haemophilus seminalis]TPG96837.1 30S ribosomal protein S12 methylthiotransf
MQNSTPSIGFVSLGCPKNLVDSERILTELRTDGYNIVPSYENVDLVIVNTCGFIDSAVQESLEAIGEALEENGRVIVTGCLGAKEDQIREVHPKVLEVSGPHSYETVMAQVHKYVPKPTHSPYTSLVPKQGVKLTPKHYAYLKISEGCDHRCTFCIIPSMRGDLESRSITQVLDEAKRLAEAGVKELLVVSQDTSAYSMDLKRQEGGVKTAFWNGMPIKNDLMTLCKQLGKLGIWVRLHYVYPYPHVDDLIPLMADGTLLPYLDIPLQHASPKILKAMKRPGSIDRTLERIKQWREICPDLTLRSTFIVGFPGETEEDFQLLLDFLKEAQLDRVGCFKFSPVEGAPATEMADQVPEDVKEERFHRFMQLQQEISANRLKQKIGKTLDVLVDEIDEEGIIGRSKADAPEVDGLVYVDNLSGINVKVGDVIKVTITNSDEYDLWGSC